MTETEPSVETTAPAAEITYDAMGYCTICRLHRRDIERVEEMVTRGARVLTAYPGCNHPMIYRSGSMRR